MSALALGRVMKLSCGAGARVVMVACLHMFAIKWQAPPLALEDAKKDNRSKTRVVRIQMKVNRPVATSGGTAAIFGIAQRQDVVSAHT